MMYVAASVTKEILTRVPSAPTRTLLPDAPD